NTECLRVKLPDPDRAKDIGTREHTKRPPRGEHDQSQRNPATAGGHVLHPLRGIYEGEVPTSQSCARTAEHHREITVSDHWNPERVGGCVTVADGAQHQSLSCVKQEP